MVNEGGIDMNAPDKIYINGDAASDLIYPPGEDDSKEEYIRKDALLKLLKPEMDIAYSDGYERGCIDGRNGFKEELIEKIKSL